MGTLSNLNGLTEPQIPSEIARDAEVTSAIANHIAAADPHPIYLTQVEGDGRYRQSAVALADADIPAAMARDAEVTSAIANHVNATDPHPIYLTQTEGDGRYRQSAVALADADIPAGMARDLEVTSAIATHIGAADPHPGLWTRIANAFLALAGGQVVIKNNPAPSAVSYAAGQNHLELRTTDGSNPIIGFHKSGFSASALYHLGYGDNSLRLRNADGLDAAILHDGNIATKTAGNSNNLLNLLGGLAASAAHWNGSYRWRHLGGWAPDDNAILVHRAFVADRAANADFASGIRTDNSTPLKTKLVQGTMGAAQGDMVMVPHGLDINKILSVQVVVRSNVTIVPEAFQNSSGTSGGFRFSWSITQGDLYINNVQGESVGLLSKPFFALITYLA